MSFFTDLLALAPAVLWKLDEASGTVAADATGNGRSGTIPAAGFTLNQASLIPAEPSSGSMANTGGTDNYISRAHEAWMNGGAAMTAAVVIRPSSLAGQRDIIGKLESWQLWLETSGRLTYYVTPMWTGLTTADTAAGKVTVGAAYLVVVRKIGAPTNLISVWINGVKVAQASHSSALSNSPDPLRAFGSSIGANRSFPGRQQSFAYWPGVALTDVQIADLYTSFITPPPDPPDDPGAFTAPLAGATVYGDYLVAWGVSADATSYELELDTGSGFSPLASPAGNSYLWSVPPVNAVGYQLRVRAVDSGTGLTSDWVESGVFDTIVPPTPPSLYQARRAWAFTLDGHIFYVLGEYLGYTILYNARTGQWCRWKTTGYSFWNARRGVMWRGRILAADSALPVVWEVDPEAGDDEDGGPVERIVTGFISSRSRDSRRVGAARLTASVGDPDAPGIPVILRYSDDEGETWSQPQQVLLQAADYDQELKFRSLGRLREPGRLWEISDAGGLVRIDGLDADIEGEEQEMPVSPGTST